MMAPARPIHETLRRVHTMDRRQCIDELMHFQDIPLDFSEEFLEESSTQRLHHLLCAAIVTADRRHGCPTTRRTGR